MKIRWIPLMAAAGLGLFLCTCSGDSKAPQPTLVPTAVPTPVYPDCDPDLLMSAQLVSPGDSESVSSLKPLFEWAMAGYVVEDPSEPDEKTLCKVEGFKIYIDDGPLYGGDMMGETGGVPGMDSLYTKTWMPLNDLVTGREYHWYVVPVSQGVEGPASETRTLFVGAACGDGNLVSPIPIGPLNHWIVDDLGDFALTWEYPGECLPDGYGVTLSESLALDSSPLNFTLDAPYTRWEVGALVEDCRRYYWQVKAIQDGSEGQDSQLYTFRVDLTGSCPAEVAGNIHGTLWEDQCYAFGGSDPLPFGCILNEYDMLFANQTYDPGEPGIGGAVVTLAQGACPSGSISRAVPTWHDGTYDFYQITPGTYCIGIDIYNAWNVFLEPGTWTFPEEAVLEIEAEQTVVVDEGEKENVDFGWWFTYGNGWGEETGTVMGTVWHDLCEYIPGDPEPDPIPGGAHMMSGGRSMAMVSTSHTNQAYPGLWLTLDWGTAPSSGYATAVTDYNGVYHFNDLPAGKYCLRIDPAHGSSNEVILMPGSWTKEPSGHEGMTFRAITIEGGSTLPGQDFGWDYDLLPSSSAVEPPMLALEINANCRFGPSLEYDVYDYGLAGDVFPIMGRDEDNNWLLVRFTDLIECWMGRATGIARGDTWMLPVFEGPPLPTATPVCSIYTDEKSCELYPDICEWKIVPGARVGCVNR